MSFLVRMSFVITGILLLSFSSAEAKWWHHASLAKEMDLTKEQIAAFDKILSETQKGIQGFQAESEKWHTDLLAVLKDDKARPEKKNAEANLLVTKISETNGKIVQKRYGMKVMILQMLKAKQLNVLITKYPRALERPWDVSAERGGGRKK